jgi:hypothetical protein
VAVEAAEAQETQRVKMALPVGREAAQAVKMEQEAAGAVARGEAGHSRQAALPEPAAAVLDRLVQPAVYLQVALAATMVVAVVVVDTMAEEEDKVTMTVPQEPAVVRR